MDSARGNECSCDCEISGRLPNRSATPPSTITIWSDESRSALVFGKYSSRLRSHSSRRVARRKRVNTYVNQSFAGRSRRSNHPICAVRLRGSFYTFRTGTETARCALADQQGMVERRLADRRRVDLESRLGMARRPLAAARGSRQRWRRRSGAGRDGRAAPALWRLLAPSAGFERRLAVGAELLGARRKERGRR